MKLFWIIMIAIAGVSFTHAEAQHQKNATSLVGIAFTLKKEAGNGYTLKVTNLFPENVSFVYTGPLSAYSFQGEDDTGKVYPAKKSSGYHMRILRTLKPNEKHIDKIILVEIFSADTAEKITYLVGEITVRYKKSEIRCPFKFKLDKSIQKKND